MIETEARATSNGRRRFGLGDILLGAALGLCLVLGLAIAGDCELDALDLALIAIVALATAAMTRASPLQPSQPSPPAMQRRRPARIVLPEPCPHCGHRPVASRRPARIGGKSRPAARLSLVATTPSRAPRIRVQP